MQTHWQPDKDRLLQPAAESGAAQFPQIVSLYLHRILFVLFLVWFLVECWWLRAPAPSRWHTGVFLGLTVVTTVVSLSRRVPLQSVMVASLLVLALSGIVQAIGARTGIPFGLFIYTDAAGTRPFNLLPWTIPLLWLVVVFNCRGVARLILRPWRKVRVYGFWVMGITCVLAALFGLGLEPFATRVNRYWLWQNSANSLVWYGTPWLNFFGWAMTALLILAFATPWLINKRPGRRRPPDYHPLIVWLSLNLYFMVAVALHQLWPAVWLISIVCVVVTTAALRNAHW